MIDWNKIFMQLPFYQAQHDEHYLDEENEYYLRLSAEVDLPSTVKIKRIIIKEGEAAF